MPIPLVMVPGTALYLAGLCWLIFDVIRRHDAMYVPVWNQNRGSRAGPGRGPLRIGDDAPVPMPPDGRGAVLLELRFDSSAVDTHGARDFDYDGWVAAPQVRIDGRTVTAG